MADTASRVYGPALLTGAAADLYTVPASTTLIVRHIRVFNNAAGAINLTLSIGADAAGTRLYDAFPIVSKSYEDWSGFLVLATGEKFQGFGSVTNNLVITISGVLVT